MIRRRSDGVVIFLVRHGRAVFHQTCVRQLDGHWLETAGNRLIGLPAPCLPSARRCPGQGWRGWRGASRLSRFIYTKRPGASTLYVPSSSLYPLSPLFLSVLYPSLLFPPRSFCHGSRPSPPHHARRGHALLCFIFSSPYTPDRLPHRHLVLGTALSCSP